MAMRKLESKDLVGKTITKMNCNSINVIHLEFSDGTKLSIWAEGSVLTQFGSIPGFEVSDDSQDCFTL